MEKRGQFYIIAAAIISVLLVGLAATVNYAVTSSKPAKFYDLGEMYKLEGPMVVDQKIYEGNPGQINEALSNFSSIFYANAQLSDPNIQVIAVYGNTTSITPINYGKEDVNLTTAQGASTTLGSSEIKSSTSLQTSAGGDYVARTTTVKRGALSNVLTPGENVVLKIGDLNYTVKLGNKQYFYFIIMSKKPTGEINVVTA